MSPAQLMLACPCGQKRPRFTTAGIPLSAVAVRTGLASSLERYLSLKRAFPPGASSCGRTETSSSRGATVSTRIVVDRFGNRSEPVVAPVTILEGTSG